MMVELVSGLGGGDYRLSYSPSGLRFASFALSVHPSPLYSNGHMCVPLRGVLLDLSWRRRARVTPLPRRFLVIARAHTRVCNAHAHRACC